MHIFKFNTIRTIQSKIDKKSFENVIKGGLKLTK